VRPPASEPPSPRGYDPISAHRSAPDGACRRRTLGTAHQRRMEVESPVAEISGVNTGRSGASARISRGRQWQKCTYSRTSTGTTPPRRRVRTSSAYTFDPSHRRLRQQAMSPPWADLPAPAAQVVEQRRRHTTVSEHLVKVATAPVICSSARRSSSTNGASSSIEAGGATATPREAAGRADRCSRAGSGRRVHLVAPEPVARTLVVHLDRDRPPCPATAGAPHDRVEPPANRLHVRRVPDRTSRVVRVRVQEGVAVEAARDQLGCCEPATAAPPASSSASTNGPGFARNRNRRRAPTR